MTNPIERRREIFAELHEKECFVIPNPWDAGSAKYLAHLGFKALATTSAGLQFGRGEPDEVWGAPVDVVLAHITDLVKATDLPVNADFQSGYARDTETLKKNVKACVACGVSGLSIEDATGDRAKPLYDLAEACERLRVARDAIDSTSAAVMLTARAESFLVGHPDPLNDAIARLTAYAEAGADVLFAPGVRRLEDIDALVRTVAPKPVNVLVSGSFGLTVARLAELGVRRISVGSALARVAYGAFIRAAREIGEAGTFEELGGAVSFAELNAVFGQDARES